MYSNIPVLYPNIRPDNINIAILNQLYNVIDLKINHVSVYYQVYLSMFVEVFINIINLRHIVCVCVLANVAWCGLPSNICVISDHVGPSGTFTTCHDCHNDFEIKQGNMIKKSCTKTGVLESKLQIRKCKNMSPHCFNCDGGYHT